MTLTASVFFAIVGAVVVTWMAIRDHRAARASRRGLLDRCAGVLEVPVIRHGKDDFPNIEGIYRGTRVRADFVPDTMTIRRLPQLWLSLTRFEARPGSPEFAVLVRPAGTEFYSLTSYYERRLEPPPGLPDEVLVRGQGPGAQALLDSAGPCLAGIFADPRIKEAGVTAKGLRLVWQGSEGRRGEHLLLRQSQFDAAEVEPQDFVRLLERLEDLSRAAPYQPEARAP